MKSTLRTDFSERKSVFGLNLNPDFPIERTLKKTAKSILLSADDGSFTKTTTRIGFHIMVLPRVWFIPGLEVKQTNVNVFNPN